MSAATLERLCAAARALSWIDRPLVFTGAATIPGHLVDPVTAAGIRETEDVDVVIGSATYTEFAQIEEELRARRFCQSLLAPHMARWSYAGLNIDIVSAGSLRPDAWVHPRAESVLHRQIQGFDVPILRLPYLLAAKIEALRDPERIFHDDLFASRDMEDIVVLLEGADVEGGFQGAGSAVRRYVAGFLKELARMPDLKRVLEFQVTPSPDREARMARVGRRIVHLAASA